MAAIRAPASHPCPFSPRSGGKPPTGTGPSSGQNRYLLRISSVKFSPLAWRYHLLMLSSPCRAVSLALLSPAAGPRLYSLRSSSRGTRGLRPACHAEKEAVPEESARAWPMDCRFPWNGGTGASFAVGITDLTSGVLQPPLLGWNTQGPRFARQRSLGRAIRVISGSGDGPKYHRARAA
jgi:hypothetical protein